MEKMKLKDLINIRTGKLDANASSENGKYPFFTCSKETLKINTYSYDCECVLLAGNGDLNVKYYNGKFDAYQRTYILECKNDIISTKYLYYFMKKYLKILRNQSVGGVIKYIKLANITEAIIPIYSKEEQEKIANNISKVEEVLNIKNKQIEELQNFIKSQFVEMFGNPIINDKKFEFKQIGEVTKIVTGTTPDTNDVENWNGGINWITPAEIKEDTLYVYETERKITEKGQKSKSLTLMPKGTVIFSTRAPIGKTAIAGNEMCCNQGFKNCICSININNIYLYYVLKNNTIYFNNLGTGATFKELSKRVFEKIKIAVPPIDLQNQFSEIVKQIDKQKFESMIQLKMMEKIYNIINDRRRYV